MKDIVLVVLIAGGLLMWTAAVIGALTPFLGLNAAGVVGLVTPTVVTMTIALSRKAK